MHVGELGFLDEADSACSARWATDLHLGREEVKAWIEGMCKDAMIIGVKEIEQALGELKTLAAPRVGAA